MARTQTERKNEWNAKNYDRVALVLKAGEREILKDAARAEGKKVNRFIIEAINTAHPGLLTLLDDTSKEKKMDPDNVEYDPR